MSYVIFGAFHRAGALRQDEDARSRLSGDQVRDRGRIPRLDEDDPDTLLAHASDQRDKVLRGGRNAGPVLDDTGLDEAERAVKVGPAIVIADDPRAAEGRERGFPAPVSFGEPVEKRAAIRLQDGGQLGRDAAQGRDDGAGDDRNVRGVERVVGIAQRMHVTQRAVDEAGRDLEHRDALACLDYRGGTPPHPGVPGALGDRIHPRVFLEAVPDQDVGPSDEKRLARTDLHVVRVLAEPRGHLDRGLVPDDGARQRPQVRQGRDDTELRLRGEGREGRERQRQCDDEPARRSDRSRRPHQKRSVGWAPSTKEPWRKISSVSRLTDPVSTVCLYCSRKWRNSEGLNWT